MKKCPYCAEEIQDEAIKCKYCKEHLSSKENIKSQEQVPASKPSLFDTIAIGIFISILIGLFLLFVYKYQDKKPPVNIDATTDYFKHGFSSYEKGNFIQAISDYTKSIEIKPSAAAYNNRGMAYYKQGNLPQASSDFTKAIEMDPSNTKTYIYRGTIYSTQDDLPKAIFDFTKAIEIDPNSAMAYIARGTIYSMQDDLPKAISDFTKAIEIDPNSARAYRGRGIAYFNQGKLPQANFDFNKAVELNPKDNNMSLLIGMALNQKAYRLYKRGEDLEEGIKLIDKALEKVPNNGIFLSTKAELLYKLGRYSEAHEYIMRGIKLEPNQLEIQNDVKMIEEALNKSKNKSSK